MSWRSGRRRAVATHAFDILVDHDTIDHLRIRCADARMGVVETDADSLGGEGRICPAEAIAAPTGEEFERVGYAVGVSPAWRIRIAWRSCWRR